MTEAGNLQVTRGDSTVSGYRNSSATKTYWVRIIYVCTYLDLHSNLCRYLRPIHTYTQLATRSTEHAARSTDHFNSYFHGRMNTDHACAWSNILFSMESWNLLNSRFSSMLHPACCAACCAACSVQHAACCVLRVSTNRTMGIHSFNFSSVLPAACKYESGP